MHTLRVNQIVHESHVDGPGERAVVYLQGCPIHCPGCQSPHLWDESGGTEWTVEDLTAELLDANKPVTISGGEPFAQADGVAILLAMLRVQQPNLHVIVYSGFVLEDILEMAEAIPTMMVILDLADILVDGPFIAGEDHDWVQWRGSANQRPIYLRSSLRHGWLQNLMVLDWDTQVLTISEDGEEIIGTAGVMRALFDDLESTRRCGETQQCGQTRQNGQTQRHGQAPQLGQAHQHNQTQPCGQARPA